MRFRTRLQYENMISLPSMADIALLLISFFLLTSTFAKDAGLDISLPSAASRDMLPRREINIWITREGTVLLDRRPVAPEQLPAALAAALAQTSLKAVTIRGDQGVRYGVVVDIMDIAKQLGASITLAAVFEQSVAPPPP